MPSSLKTKIYFDKKKGLCIERSQKNNEGKENHNRSGQIFLGWLMIIESLFIILGGLGLLKYFFG